MKSLSTSRYPLVAIQGFSLIEFLLYTAVMAGIMIFIGGIMISTNRASALVDAKSVVNSNLRLALERIRQDVKDATSFATPFPGFSSNTLVLKIGGDTITYDASGGRLRRKVNSGSPKNITANQVTITASDLTFKQFQNPSIPMTFFAISINTSITAKYNSSSPDYNFSETRTKTALNGGLFSNLRGSYGIPGSGGQSNCTSFLYPSNKRFAWLIQDYQDFVSRIGKFLLPHVLASEEGTPCLDFPKLL